MVEVDEQTRANKDSTPPPEAATLSPEQSAKSEPPAFMYAIACDHGSVQVTCEHAERFARVGKTTEVLKYQLVGKVSVTLPDPIVTPA